MWRNHMMGYGSGGSMMFLWWIIIFIIVGFVIYFFIKKTSSGSESKEKPIDILKQRYAKGEISKEQFEELKKDLY